MSAQRKANSIPNNPMIIPMNGIAKKTKKPIAKINISDVD
jgi:hypothetical protein